MKLALALGLTLISSVSFASALDEAVNVCLKNRTETYRQGCLDYVSRKAFYYDELAVRICDGLVYDVSRYDCLVMTSNRKYDLKLLKYCGIKSTMNGIINDNNAIVCIFETPKKHYMAD